MEIAFQKADVNFSFTVGWKQKIVQSLRSVTFTPNFSLFSLSLVNDTFT